MKELTYDEINEKVKTFSSGWIRVNEGESAKIIVRSKTIYDVPAGDEGLDGAIKDFDRWQSKVEDKDGIVKIMTIQQRLAKAMLDTLEEKGLDWNKHFDGSEWYIERIDQWNWKIELLNWNGKSGVKTETKSTTKTSKLKSDDRLSLSPKTQIAYDLIMNNELNKKDMTYDSLKTVVSSLTELSVDDATTAVQEMMSKKMLSVKDDKVVWAI